MSSNREDNVPPQATVVVLSGDPRLADLAAQAAREAGALVCLADDVDALDGQRDCPVAVIRGADINPEVDLAITSTWPDSALAVACLGASASGDDNSTSRTVTEPLPRPTRAAASDWKEPDQVNFAMPDQADDLVQWVEAALVPPRDHRRVAVVAASGGIGATTLAVALARQLAKGGASGASLIDLNPAGTPLTALVGTDPNAPGWVELLHSDQPTPDCQPGGVCLVGGARAIDPRIKPAELRRAVEAVESARPGAVTIFDACAAAPLRLRRLAGWCDNAVLLTRADPVGRAAVLPLARAALRAGCQVTLVVRPVRGGLDPAELKTLTGANDCVVLKNERALARAMAHGSGPSDRPRGPVGRTAAHLANTICSNPDKAAWVEKSPPLTRSRSDNASASQDVSGAVHRSRAGIVRQAPETRDQIGRDDDKLDWTAPLRRGLPGLGCRRNPQPVSWPVANADIDLVETVTIAKLGLDPAGSPRDQPDPPILGPDGQPEVFAGIKTGPRLSWRQRQDLRPTPIDLGGWTEEW